MSDKLMNKFFDEGAYTALFAGKEGGVDAGFGSVNGCPVYCVEQNGKALVYKEIEKMIKVLDLAVKTGNPVVTVYNSNGSDLTEGMSALTGMARLNAKIAQISGVVPQIAVVTGVCGASASLAAANADICIAVKGSELFLTPVFTAKANGDKEAVSSVDAAAKAGVAQIVAEDVDEAVAVAAKLASMLPANNLSGVSSFEYDEPAKVLQAQDYTAQNVIDALADGDSAVELMTGFGKKITAVLATVAGGVCGILATSGPKDTLCQNCTAKAARFIRLCDAFGIPVVTVLNTDGFKKSSTEEIAGGLRQAARLSATCADATTARINIIAGKAVGVTYSAFAGADYTIVTNDSLVAPIEPAAAVTVLYKDELEAGSSIEKDTVALAEKYKNEVCGPTALVEAGVADAVVPTENLRAGLVAALDMLSSKRVQRLPKKHGNMAL